MYHPQMVGLWYRVAHIIYILGCNSRWQNPVRWKSPGLFEMSARKMSCFCWKIITGWWSGTLFFHILGIIIPIIFQRGWNHQPDQICFSRLSFGGVAWSNGRVTVIWRKNPANHLPSRKRMGWIIPTSALGQRISTLESPAFMCATQCHGHPNAINQPFGDGKQNYHLCFYGDDLGIVDIGWIPIPNMGLHHPRDYPPVI